MGPWSFTSAQSHSPGSSDGLVCCLFVKIAFFLNHLIHPISTPARMSLPPTHIPVTAPPNGPLASAPHCEDLGAAARCIPKYSPDHPSLCLGTSLKCSSSKHLDLQVRKQTKDEHWPRSHGYSKGRLDLKSVSLPTSGAGSPIAPDLCHTASAL